MPNFRPNDFLGVVLAWRIQAHPLSNSTVSGSMFSDSPFASLLGAPRTFIRPALLPFARGE